MKSCYVKDKQQGMTLIEILVAMTLGAFLLTGVMQIFLNSKQTYRMQDNLSRMQENGRFAMEFIAREIRAADYKECFSDTSSGGEVFSPDDVNNTPDRVSVIQKTNACGVADTFSAISFFIQDANNQPALHRVTTTGSATVAAATTAINTEFNSADANDALIEGIENMQILYGEDTDTEDTPGYGTPDYYVNAASVVDMDRVVSVRISLLIRSINNNLAPAPTAYVFNGASTTPAAGDRRLRRVFTSTIVLRNRIQ